MYRPVENFDLDELSLYFETVAKDRTDAHAAGRRNGELLDLRDQMLRLTDQEFDVLIRTFRAAVKDMVVARDPEGETDASSQPAQNLYNEVRGGGGASDTKVSAIA